MAVMGVLVDLVGKVGCDCGVGCWLRLRIGMLAVGGGSSTCLVGMVAGVR
jgi:hypothetical protein